MILSHERVQFPIGQGFFHAGNVQVAAAAFSYVYDCGSTSKSNVNREVDVYIDERDSSPRIDALFLSHIDNDHVSGLDRLLVYAKPDSVFLPLLSPIARLALIAHAIGRGTLTADNLSLLADPGQWFRDRGANQVFFISGDEGPSANGVGPFRPDDQPPTQPNRIGFDIKKLIHLADDYEGRTFGDQTLRARFRPGSKRIRSVNPETYVLSHSQPLFLMGNNAILDWVFIAFVRPDSDGELRFRHVVSQRRLELGVVPTTAKAFRDWAFEVVRTKERRRILKGCYHAAGVDVNRMSMSLYSGPTGMSAGVETTISVYAPPYDPWLQQRSERCAWLGTGDSNLSRADDYAVFAGHYSQVLQQVVTLALPHHGSRHNFNRALTASGAERFLVSSRLRNPHHPHISVRSAINPLGFVHVTQDEDSRFEEWVQRKYGP